MKRIKFTFCFVPGILFVCVCGVSVVTSQHINLNVPHMDHIINKRSAYSPGNAEREGLTELFYLCYPHAQICMREVKKLNSFARSHL